MYCDTAKAVRLVQYKRFKKPNLKKKFEPGVQPMEFVSMDLIGEFHPPLIKRKQVCTNSSLYAYRIYFLHTHQEQIS